MLVLVHHGHALVREVDPTQPLSGPGRAASEHLALEAAARGVRPDAVWHSGKFRARQTAELFLRACNPHAVFSVARGLQPTDPPGVVQSRVESNDRSLLLVGHMPHLERLLRALCGESPGSVTPDFPSHGCVALRREGEHWQELWRLARS
ncbi:MAG: phosphohistidine phosphatase SixA [Acidobacteria bacterium]|nr:phosphohistidine phosphatase SixA [Acidobacteriota bacterium]